MAFSAPYGHAPQPWFDADVELEGHVLETLKFILPARLRAMRRARVVTRRDATRLSAPAAVLRRR